MKIIKLPEPLLYVSSSSLRRVSRLPAFTKRLVLCLCGILTLCRSAFGGGTVANCTQHDLEAALAGGGTVLFAGDCTITLTNTITISKDTFIDANGHAVVISGGNAVRLFQVASNVNFRAKGLTLADGRVVGQNGPNGDPAPPGQDAFGAGILNQGGNVTLTECTLINHSVQGGNAGQDLSNIYGNKGTGGSGMGPAIYNVRGMISLTNCLVAGNTATGGLGSPPTGPFSQQVAGDCGHACGGAIYSVGGTATLQAVTLAVNSAHGGTPQFTGGGHARSRGRWSGWRALCNKLRHLYRQLCTGQ